MKQQTTKKQRIPESIKSDVWFLCAGLYPPMDLAGYAFNFKGRKLINGYFCKPTEAETVKARFGAFYDFETKLFTVKG